MYLTTQPQNTKCHHPRTNSLRLAQGKAATYDRRCGQSSRTAPSLPGHRFGHTRGEPGMRTLAHRCMYTKSSHREPQRARDPPEGGSGQKPRQSSGAGTAPTWPAGKETLSAWPKDGAGLGHVLTYVPLRMAPGCTVGIQQVLCTALRALDRAASGFRGGGNNSSSLTWPLLFLDLNSLHYQIKDLTGGGHFFMQ